MIARPRRELLALLASALLGAWSIAAPSVRADDAGESIYSAKCASCHGASGEGSEDYPKSLAGDRSVAQLAKLIAKTMPADDPGTCTGDDSVEVATYIYDSFYSPAARAKGNAARVDLSRLTVHQYRNTLSDLVGSFRGSPPRGGEPGVSAEYYKSRRFRGGDKVAERIDPAIAFDFGDGPAIEGKMEPHEFAVRWQGSITPPETGEYEFLVRTEHAMRLWVNDPNTALIDALVKSGSDDEYKASIYLLGGRSYPLKLEFTKANQGVDDSKKAKKRPPAKASIALLWKPPGGVVDVVPARCLATSRGAEVFCPATPFPPDDKSLGYERGSAISKQWDNAATDGAIEAVSYIFDHRRELANLRDDDGERAKKARDFARTFAERAFRRPLTPELETLYVGRFFDGGNDPESALKRSLLMILKSPRFLYREIGGAEGDPFDVASRLAYTLWDAPPDKTLMDAARKRELSTREQIRKQAERMASDPKAKAKLREFLVGWLKIVPSSEIAKDPEKFPEFTPELAADLRTSLDLFLDDVIDSDNSDYRDLLVSESLYLNGRLAPLYGADLPPDAPFQKVAPEASGARGSPDPPVPSWRRSPTPGPRRRSTAACSCRVACSAGRSRPPPEAVAPLAPDLHPSLSTRERTSLQTSPAACMTCHGMINPLGFTMERFDAIGRYRTEERDRAIDPTGSYQTKDEGTATFADARDLARFLATSDEAHDAFTRSLFHNLVKQSILAYGPDAPRKLRGSFEDGGYSVRRLMVEIAVLAATPD